MQSFEAQNMSITALDATYFYVKHMETVYPAVEGRIIFVEEDRGHDSASKATSNDTHSLVMGFIASLLLSCQFSSVIKHLI